MGSSGHGVPVGVHLWRRGCLPRRSLLDLCCSEAFLRFSRLWRCVARAASCWCRWHSGEPRKRFELAHAAQKKEGTMAFACCYGRVRASAVLAPPQLAKIQLIRVMRVKTHGRAPRALSILPNPTAFLNTRKSADQLSECVETRITRISEPSTSHLMRVMRVKSYPQPAPCSKPLMRGQSQSLHRRPPCFRCARFVRATQP